MSLFKRHMEEVYARGYEDTDKVVCAGCFSDKYLRGKIRRNGEIGVCSFCGSRRKVISLERVLEDIVNAIRFYYTNADEELIWDGEEERWVGRQPLDIYDVIHNDISYELGIENTALIDELTDKINIGLLVGSDRRKNIVYRKLDKWKKFVKMINLPEYQSLSSDQIVKFSVTNRSENLTAPMTDIMESVLHFCNKFKTFKYLKDTVPIYRCVRHIDDLKHIPGIFHVPAIWVGTAPSKFVKDNRMSECGEEVFYGATDILTALVETNDWKRKDFWVGCFKTNHRFIILDLSQLDDKLCPSWLEVEKNDERESYKFLKLFEEEIVKDRGTYRPTQVFAKFIQRMTDVNGIKYKSNKMLKKSFADNKHSCYALYVSGWDCLELGEKADKKRNQLIMQEIPTKYSKKELNRLLLSEKNGKMTKCGK